MTAEEAMERVREYCRRTRTRFPPDMEAHLAVKDDPFPILRTQWFVASPRLDNGIDQGAWAFIVDDETGEVRFFN